MRNLAGKAAFVTGGASGIGLALGRALAQAGCRVMLADIEEAALHNALRGFEGGVSDIRGVVCDVADPASVEAAAEKTIAAFGKVHILCNNAGVAGGSGIDDISLASWRWVIEVNLLGVVHGVAAFLPHMRAHGEGGHIVNTASMAGMLAAGMGFSPYAASKFAVVAMSEGLAAELKPLGIGVSVLCPGYVRTRIAEAGRNRQPQYGAHVGSPLGSRAAELVNAGIDPQEVAARVLDAIRNEELYAFTHPQDARLPRRALPRHSRRLRQAGRHRAVSDRSNVTPELAAEHGLSHEEFDRAVAILGRTPNLTELGIFAAMWSEHCSYKSSKAWLKTLPTTGPRVICGPGENAGVVDIGDGMAVVFKIESHNHPSFIEPYQGAATGVGGILRDVFTMGARPIAMLNSLRFGSPDHPKTRHLLGGVVAGIGGYGNCVGVPTVGGECQFHPAYNGNILVNAMCVGLARADRIFYSAAAGPGNLVIYVGAKTGRDGIHGATMASAEFGEDAGEMRPTVQVGDPFTEKLLIEACLELMETDAIVAIQDMGAAGLTSSSVEMAGKGGLGIELDLDRVPVREEHMTPYEIVLSESQERMLMILAPGSEQTARRVFDKWELDFAVIGRVTETGRLVLRMHGETAAEIPVEPLVTEAPLYRRPYTRRDLPRDIDPAALPARDPIDGLTRLVASPDLASKRWIWEQYDHLVQGNTVKRPGGDAAVIRIADSGKALALKTDATPRYCRADPERGGMQAVAESWRNLTAVGALPLALTDNMNFGNPEKPEIMGEFVGVIEGMRAACEALDYPVVSGNVSLYNETSGSAILPTPVIGGVGLIADASKAVDLALKRDGNELLLVGDTGNPKEGHLGASIYLREIEGREEGPPPPIDLAAEKRHGDLVRRLIEQGLVAACHDISDGGLLIALAEMAMAGGCGIAVDPPPAGRPALAWYFAEDQARYVVETGDPEHVLTLAREAGVPARRIGTVRGHGSAAELTLSGGGAISVAELKAAHEAWLPGYMAQG